VAAAESSVVAAHPVQENLRGELRVVFHCSSACISVHSVQLDASDTLKPSRSDLRIFTWGLAIMSDVSATRKTEVGCSHD
jgi:hypothetical protein